MGACRTDEMVNMNIQCVEDKNDMYVVKIVQSKIYVQRSFTISTLYFEIVQKYITLRPKNMPTDRFFINYRNGRCTKQVIGRNKFSKTPKKIAEFLRLPNAERYTGRNILHILMCKMLKSKQYVKVNNCSVFTGHSFRQTSTTLLANAGADIVRIKRHGAWKSSTIAESYIEDSLFQKKKTEELISSRISSSLLNNEASSLSSVLELEREQEFVRSDMSSENILVDELSNNLDSQVTEMLNSQSVSSNTCFGIVNEKNIVFPLVNKKSTDDLNKKFVFNNCSNVTININ